MDLDMHLAIRRHLMAQCHRKTYLVSWEVSTMVFPRIVVLTEPSMEVSLIV